MYSETENTQLLKSKNIINSFVPSTADVYDNKRYQIDSLPVVDVEINLVCTYDNIFSVS